MGKLQAHSCHIVSIITGFPANSFTIDEEEIWVILQVYLREF